MIIKNTAMNILNFLSDLFIKPFFSSATPNLFGSKKRMKAKEKIAADYRSTIDENFQNTQSELDKEIGSIQSQNPFETAAAKSAMATASRKAKQTQERFSNILGGNTNPEAIIASQQATQEAIAGSAGDIAVGSEAQKQARLDMLGAEKRQGRDVYSNQVAQAGLMETAAVNEIGQGWKDFFGALDSIVGLTGGIGSAIGSFSSPSGT